MLKQTLYFILICVTVSLNAQISPRLEKRCIESPNATIPVIVEFSNTIDWVEFNDRLVKERLPVSEWPGMVNRVLMKQAENSQQEVLEYLKSLGEGDLKSATSFYIVNAIVLEAKPDVIEAIADFVGVNWIDLAEGEIVLDEPILETKSAGANGLTGPEPGLEAVNAPELWKLGYTGRGRKVYNYDTGVWATHPAFKDRFLGNFKPLSQSWYGLVGNYPDGRISDHGTHTLGTMAGLDTATNDTIGMAFGAYWMANDYVNSTVATLPPLAEMIKAFEWALNPDGDTATNDDVPDVINNSWRWRDDPDTVQCGGYIVHLMNAIEAAGIANVFSGGNAGPNNSTISAPQRINTNKTSTFSVGSIDANQSFPYPISSFSSRGPTQCPGSGNLKIHPEVVAPGHNVRSAWGKDGYNTISGTSMAAPHVSGAVLLLKEAFPQLSGAQLLTALYTTAVDMGVSGEDNIYGNGLIDVFAAYQYLAQSHTPVDPNAVAWDIAVKDVYYSSVDREVTCYDKFDVTLVVENLGNNRIDSFYVWYWLDDSLVFPSAIHVDPWNQLGPGATFSIRLPNRITVNGLGNHTLKVAVGLGTTDYDLLNNQRIQRFNKREERALSYTEDFENYSDDGSWFLENQDLSFTWDTTSVNGWAGNNKALVIRYWDYMPRTGQIDRLWSPVFRVPQGAAGFAFDLAYQQRATVAFLQDTLRLVASTNCGKTFPHVLYDKSGADLNTVGNTGLDFVPGGKSDWRREYVDLSSLAGQEVILAFEGVNRGGNNLYLDNISVYQGYWDPVGLEELARNKFNLYPNPAEDVIRIESLDLTPETIVVQIFDLKGVPQSKSITLGGDGIVDICYLPKGLYMVKVQYGDKVQFLRFVKE